MIIYELKVENFKKDGWTEVFYLVPCQDRLEMYLRRDERLEKVKGITERGWNLYAGGRVNLRTLRDAEAEEVSELVQKTNASWNEFISSTADIPF